MIPNGVYYAAVPGSPGWWVGLSFLNGTATVVGYFSTLPAGYVLLSSLIPPGATINSLFFQPTTALAFTGVTASGAPSTLQFDFAPIAQTTAQLGANAGYTGVVTSSTIQLATQIVPVAARNTVEIDNPVDGELVYLGTTNTTNYNNGGALYPGNKAKIYGYIGAVYAQGVTGTKSVFYMTS